MRSLAFLLIASVVPSAALGATPTKQQLAERFLSLAMPETPLTLNGGPNLLAEALVRANPEREAEARKIADQAEECIRGHQGQASMRQAALEAALQLPDGQLERLMAFAEMRAAQMKAGGSNQIPPEWQAVRSEFGKWMYSIPAQPSAVTLMRTCIAETAKRIAAAGLRE